MANGVGPTVSTNAPSKIASDILKPLTAIQKEIDNNVKFINSKNASVEDKKKAMHNISGWNNYVDAKRNSYTNVAEVMQVQTSALTALRKQATVVLKNRDQNSVELRVEAFKAIREMKISGRPLPTEAQTSAEAKRLVDSLGEIRFWTADGNNPYHIDIDSGSARTPIPSDRRAQVLAALKIVGSYKNAWVGDGVASGLESIQAQHDIPDGEKGNIFGENTLIALIKELEPYQTTQALVRTNMPNTGARILIPDVNTVLTKAESDYNVFWREVNAEAATPKVQGLSADKLVEQLNALKPSVVFKDKEMPVVTKKIAVLTQALSLKAAKSNAGATEVANSVAWNLRKMVNDPNNLVPYKIDGRESRENFWVSQISVLGKIPSSKLSSEIKGGIIETFKLIARSENAPLLARQSAHHALTELKVPGFEQKVGG